MDGHADTDALSGKVRLASGWSMPSLCGEPQSVPCPVAVVVVGVVVGRGGLGRLCPPTEGADGGPVLGVKGDAGSAPDG
jgi:hypothetical protein